MNNYFLLLPPYESGVFVKKDLEKNEMKKIIIYTYNALINKDYSKSTLKDENYKNRLIVEKENFIKKYFDNGVFNETYPT
jgi:hypothetical protein